MFCNEFNQISYLLGATHSLEYSSVEKISLSQDSNKCIPEYINVL